MSGSLSPLFRPQRVAVVGASSNPEKMGFQIFRNIVDAGFQGEIIPVNPKGETVLGRSSLKSAAELPEGTDLAVVIIPAKLVPGTILQLGERKVRAAIVISGGFAESGDEGAAIQEEMTRNALRSGIRVVGPNCQGINYPYHGLCASWPLITRRGDIAFISQSGTVGAAMIDWASEDRLGFSAFVSMGNRADVDEADLIEFFAADPNTKVVSLYIEGVKDAKKFLAAVGKCRKPVVIFKAGRTERGRKAAESHTRSLAGRDEIYDAVFRQFGIHRAHSLEDLYDFSKALAYLPAPSGPRTLIVTSSGGSAIIATDVAEEEGFRVTPLPADLAVRLREMLPSHCIVGNPLDLTGDTDAARYRKVLDAAAGQYDVVMAIFGDPIPGTCDVITPGRCELVSYLGGADVERAERLLLQERKIAVFPTPERAVRALACHARFNRERFPLGEEPAGLGSADEGRKAHTPATSMQLLSEAGFPVVPFKRAETEEDAVAAARKIGYPVAVKMNSPDITHKSDLGGVILGVADEAGVRQAFRGVSAAVKNAGARDEGVIVSAMAAPGREVIVGVVRDLQFGPAVMFGMGGILVEALGDVSVRVVPLSGRDAEEMIAGIRGSMLLKGYRGGKPVDTASIRELLLKVSEFAAANPDVAELDLNPVIVHESGLSIVDARVIPAQGAV
ncbi:MAG: CoA-binding domain protein [Actinobacteria bacterium]|nr:CoA-binding domain protein [Actinomycetota bacterium]MBM2828932.1 CoA-binding domain protein [Actinomycetota bacterium]